MPIQGLFKLVVLSCVLVGSREKPSQKPECVFVQFEAVRKRLFIQLVVNKTNVSVLGREGTKM